MGRTAKAGVTPDFSHSDLDGWFRKENFLGTAHVKCLGGEARQPELLWRFLKKQRDEDLGYDNNSSLDCNVTAGSGDHRTFSVDPSRFFRLVTEGGHTSLGPPRDV